MAPPSKSPATASARRKSSKASLVVTLKLSPQLLQKFTVAPVKEEKVIKEDTPIQESPSIISNTLPVVPSSNGDILSESTTNTPATASTPVPSSMPPPTEIVKKRGAKRSGPALGPDGLPKPRGKPGPKKKARLEDGSIDHSGTAPRAANGTAAHKLGPKANQGAINAGLRALDRSGKPCRKWQRGSFKLKSFTGVVWEIPRWTAPPKLTLQLNPESSGSGSGESSKENKDNSQMESEKSEKSNSGVDVDMKSNISNLVSSPAPSLPAPSPVPTSTPIPAAVVEAPA